MNEWKTIQRKVKGIQREIVYGSRPVCFLCICLPRRQLTAEGTITKYKQYGGISSYEDGQGMGGDGDDDTGGGGGSSGERKSFSKGSKSKAKRLRTQKSTAAYRSRVQSNKPGHVKNKPSIRNSSVMMNINDTGSLHDNNSSRDDNTTNNNNTVTSPSINHHNDIDTSQIPVSHTNTTSTMLKNTGIAKPFRRHKSMSSMQAWAQEYKDNSNPLSNRKTHARTSHGTRHDASVRPTPLQRPTSSSLHTHITSPLHDHTNNASTTTATHAKRRLAVDGKHSSTSPKSDTTTTVATNRTVDNDDVDTDSQMNDQQQDTQRHGDNNVMDSNRQQVDSTLSMTTTTNNNTYRSHHNRYQSDGMPLAINENNDSSDGNNENVNDESMTTQNDADANTNRPDDTQRTYNQSTMGNESMNIAASQDDHDDRLLSNDGDDTHHAAARGGAPYSSDISTSAAAMLSNEATDAVTSFKARIPFAKPQLINRTSSVQSALCNNSLSVPAFINNNVVMQSPSTPSTNAVPPQPTWTSNTSPTKQPAPARLLTPQQEHVNTMNNNMAVARASSINSGAHYATHHPIFSFQQNHAAASPHSAAPTHTHAHTAQHAQFLQQQQRHFMQHHGAAASHSPQQQLQSIQQHHQHQHARSPLQHMNTMMQRPVHMNNGVNVPIQPFHTMTQFPAGRFK